MSTKPTKNQQRFKYKQAISKSTILLDRSIRYMHIFSLTESVLINQFSYYFVFKMYTRFQLFHQEHHKSSFKSFFELKTAVLKR